MNWKKIVTTRHSIARRLLGWFGDGFPDVLKAPLRDLPILNLGMT